MAASPQSKHITNFFTKYLNKIFQLIFSCCVCLHLTPQMWCCLFHSWRQTKVASGIMWVCQATRNMAFKAREFLYSWRNLALSHAPFWAHSDECLQFPDLPISSWMSRLENHPVSHPWLIPSFMGPWPPPASLLLAAVWWIVLCWSNGGPQIGPLPAK